MPDRGHHAWLPAASRGDLMIAPRLNPIRRSPMNRLMRRTSQLPVALFLLGSAVAAAQDQPAKRPNVVLVMSDDQGYGDLGVHGNPIIRTPNIDGMAAKSAVLTQFYVSPVCTPTRSCLMTGRYNYRTR